jgi:hypothetical protein
MQAVLAARAAVSVASGGERVAIFARPHNHDSFRTLETRKFKCCMKKPPDICLIPLTLTLPGSRSEPLPPAAEQATCHLSM